MAKEVKVSIIVDDNGSMRLTERSAKKLGAGLDKVGRSAQTTDRQLKGVAQASSNGSKNFAKQAQGISGGIVPAYAAFAAQVFALGAAFQFLKGAGDLLSLEAGQKAYAAATGVALRSLTKDIIAATDAQVTFRDASQAAAIGIASGLNPDQLIGLGKAARDVSIILGRDVTDSFNRLVRGVTKAEPELLDELGIVLRLKDATEKYADSLGVNVNNLSAFQRSQAVANEVLSQTEQKYSAILDIVDPTVNKFNKFGKVFDDIANTIRRVLGTYLGFVAEFAANNPLASILLLAPMLNGFFKLIFERFDGLGSITTGVLGRMSTSLDKVNNSLQIDLTQLGALKGDTKAATSLLETAGDNLFNLGRKSKQAFKGFQVLGKTGRMSLKTITFNIKQATAAQGVFAGMSESVRQEFINNFKDMEIALKSLESSAKVTTTKVEKSFTLMWVRLKQLSVKGAAAVVSTLARLAASVAKWFLRIVSGVGLVTLAFDLLPDSIKKALAGFVGFRNISEGAEKSRAKLKDLNEEFKKFSEVQLVLGQVNKEYQVSTDRLVQMGDLVNSLSFDNIKESVLDFNAAVNDFDPNNNFSSFLRFASTGASFDWVKDGLNWIADYNDGSGAVKEASKGQIEFNKTVLDGIDNLKLVGSAVDNYREQLQAQQDALQKGEIITAEQTEKLGRARDAFNELTEGVKSFKRQMLDLSKTINTSIKNLVPQSPLGPLLDQLFVLNSLYFDSNELLKGNVKLTQEGYEALLNSSPEEKKKYISLLRQTETLERQREILEDLEKATININRLNTISAFKLTSRQKKLLKITTQRLSIESKISKEEGVLLNTINSIAKTGQEKLTPDQIKRLSIQQMQVLVLKEQLEVLKEQEQWAFRLGISLKEGIEKGLDTNIYDLIVGDESSFTDGLLKTVRSAAKNVAKELSGQITDSIINVLPGFESAEDKKNRKVFETLQAGGKDIAKSIEDTFSEAVRAWKESTEDNTFAANVLKEQERLINMSRDELRKTFVDGAKAIKDAIVSGSIEASKNLNPNTGPEIYQPDPTKPMTSKQARNWVPTVAHWDPAEDQANVDKKYATGVDVEGLSRVTGITAEDILTEPADSLTKAADSLNLLVNRTRATLQTDGVSSLEEITPSSTDILPTPSIVPPEEKGFFEKLFGKQMGNTKSRVIGLGGENSDTGTEEHDPSGAGRRQGGIFGPFLNSLQNLFDPNLEGGFLSGLADVFMTGIEGFGGLFKALPDLLGGLFGGGGLGGFFSGIFGAAAGGIMPGGVTGYANGGIVKRPTLGLVGEGKMNEAVVPLPDGKAIPVNMGSGMGQNNNVTVNVSMDGQGGSTSDSSSNGQQGANMGKLIAGAVQEELQRQKRPGGILSPYGAS